MTEKIDNLDLRIIQDLLADGRKAFAAIARENSTSKEAIGKRYKQLKARGIIVGSTTQNSVYCHDYSLVANILILVRRGNLDSVMKSLNTVPSVFHAYPRIISQSILTEVTLNKIEDIDTIKRSIQSLPHVLGTEVAIWIGRKDTPQNLSIFLDNNVSITGITENMDRPSKKEEVDEIDKAIISKLSVNGRMPFALIAEPLDLSTETVSRRYERLKKNGYVKVVAQINPIKIGYYAFAYFEVSFSHGALASNIEALTKIPDINQIVKSEGYRDLYVTFMIRDIEHFLRIREQIATLPKITKIQLDLTRMFYPWPIRGEFISTF